MMLVSMDCGHRQSDFLMSSVSSENPLGKNKHSYLQVHLWEASKTYAVTCRMSNPHPNVQSELPTQRSGRCPWAG